MAQVRFIADLHFGHVNMAKKRGFATVEEHDEHIITQWNSVVKKQDLTYILGDVTMESAKPYPLLSRLNGMKKVVLGNHDLPRDIPELMKYVQSVSGLTRYKGIWLSHCPVHPMELDHRVRRVIHGHIHENIVMKETNLILGGVFFAGTRQIADDRYHGVSCEQVDYTPKTLEQLGITR
jgi:calcineurin-like phosphoesterase family protein